MTYWQLRILASLIYDGIDQQVYKAHVQNADLTALLTDTDAYRVECMRSALGFGRRRDLTRLLERKMTSNQP